MAALAQCSKTEQRPPRKIFPENIELNVGGKFYSTSVFTLTRDPDSLLGKAFSGRGGLVLDKDSCGKYFIDRDGCLFRYILDFLRSRRLQLPENFCEIERLKMEADFFEIQDLQKELDSLCTGRRKHLSFASAQPGHITLHVRSTYAFGKTGQWDVNFRKLQRILVCGKVCICREVFKESLNESRDPNPEGARYTNRFYLKHNHIEKAICQLQQCGFETVSSCGGKSGFDPGSKSEEDKWDHFVTYVFLRAF